MGACVSAGQAGHPAAKPDGSWVLVSLYGDQLPPAQGGLDADSRFTLRIDGGRAGGQGACNGWGATLSYGAGGALSFSALWSTKMMCDDYGAEQRYFQALSACASYRLEEGFLRLLDEAGSEVARFRPAVE